MLRLSGKQLYDYDKAYVGNLIKIYYTPTEQNFIIIHGSKPYDLVKEGSFLVWNIPDNILDDPIKLRVQAMDAITGITDYVTTPELVVKRFADSPGNISGDIDYDSDYAIYSMTDEHSVVRVDDRKILLPSDLPSIVSGDSSSQIIMFEVNRFYDNIDRSKKACSIEYVNANNDEGIAIVSNVYSTDTKMYFSWLLDSNVTSYPGDVEFTVKFSGTHESGQPYRWRTVSGKLKVEKGLVVDDSVIVEQYPSVIEDIQIQLVNSNERLIAHDTDNASHIDIRALIRNFASSPIDLANEATGILPIANVDIESHDTSPTAHNDIREEINDKIEDALNGVDLSQLNNDFNVIKNEVNAVGLTQFKTDYLAMKALLDGIDLVQFKTDFNILKALVDEVDLEDMRAKIDALS